MPTTIAGCDYKTPIFRSDSIGVLARRHYELELDVASEFLSFLIRSAAIARYPESPPRMRMPMNIERDMIAKFDGYKQQFSNLAFDP